MNKKYFKLFTNCIPVKGYKRSVICDLQRNSVRLIPNDLFNLLTLHQGKTKEEIFAAYGDQFNDVIQEYFDFLVGEEFAFWCDDATVFPPLNLHWDSPSVISNAIIDFDKDSQHNIPEIITELDELGCNAIQLRFYDEIGKEELNSILSSLLRSRLKSIEPVIKYSEYLDETYLSHIARMNLRISIVIIHSAPFDKAIENEYGRVYFSKEEVKSSSHCGFIDPSYFVVNMNLFTESQKHNNCLNRKISIDVRGNIKNCPAMNEKYGKFGDISLKKALQNPKFKQVWSVNKDQLETCKDCEFRYICTDCRAFTEGNDLLSKPKKCNYNPYKAKWNAEVF